MTELADELGRICVELREMHRSFALVGGLAVSTWAEPRLTRDVDLAVAVTSDLDAEGLVLELQRRGYAVLAAVEQIATGRLATVRLAPPQPQSTIVDLLFASSGIETEIVAAAELLEVLPGLVVPVARVGHLIAQKLLARDDRRRPMDADDLAALRLVATTVDWELADEGVRLISQRGASRERDLLSLLTELREHGAY